MKLKIEKQKQSVKSKGGFWKTNTVYVPLVRVTNRKRRQKWPSQEWKREYNYRPIDIKTITFVWNEFDQLHEMDQISKTTNYQNSSNMK